MVFVLATIQPAHQDVPVVGLKVSLKFTLPAAFYPVANEILLNTVLCAMASPVKNTTVQIYKIRLSRTKISSPI